MQWVWGIALILVLESMSGYSCAQSVTGSAPFFISRDPGLMQVPMLALSKNYGPLPMLTPDNVNISLDSGPAFHPTAMRIEANDPISIAIVLDASGGQAALLHHFADAVKEVASSSLSTLDTYTLFAVDCGIVRSSLNQAIEPSALKSAVNRALSDPDLHGEKSGGACGRTVRLWDAAAFASKELAKASGRRILLIVSNGADRGSTTWWNDLRAFAANQSITVLGLRDLDKLGANFIPQFPDSAAGVYYLSNSDETRYRRLCEMTGGLILATPPKELPQSLSRLIAFMKGRYILEFPQPQKPAPGGHTLDVTLPGYNAYVVVSGVTIHMAEADRRPDPSTTDPAILGKRRILPKPY